MCGHGRMVLTKPPTVASNLIDKMASSVTENNIDGPALCDLKDNEWDVMSTSRGVQIRLRSEFNTLRSNQSAPAIQGLDKGKKREASQSDDDAADSTTRYASEVRKRARSVDVDDNNNESVERRKRPRPPIHSAPDVPEKIRALREAIGKAALTEDILEDPAVCAEIPFPSVSGNP
eukprot:Opistho-2@84731